MQAEFDSRLGAHSANLTFSLSVPVFKISVWIKGTRSYFWNQALYEARALVNNPGRTRDF